MTPSTSRQRKIARLAALGLSNGEIAAELNITPAMFAPSSSPGSGGLTAGDDVTTPSRPPTPASSGDER